METTGRIFEWNDDKNEQNKCLHGISFETAALVFNDCGLSLEIGIIRSLENRV